MKRTVFYIALIVIVVVVLGGIFGYRFYQDYKSEQASKNKPAQYATVSTVTAKSENWTPTLSSVGTLVAVQGVNVTTQVSGLVNKITFQSGASIKKGALLVTLDDRADVQQLNYYLAQLKYSKTNLARVKKVYESGGVSQSDYEKAVSDNEENLANVRKQQVTIEYKHIKAPFSGKLGIREVNLGQYINAGDSVVNMQSQDPIYVDFDLPEQNLPDLKIGLKVAITVDSAPGKTFVGKITSMAAKVDQATRNVAIRATIPNTQHLLYPGLFANVVVSLDEQKKAVMVDRVAIDYSLYGDVVYIATAKGKSDQGSLYTVKRSEVTVGAVVGNMVIVKSGVKAGQIVVNAGQLKLQDGATVLVNNTYKFKKMTNSQLSGA